MKLMLQKNLHVSMYYNQVNGQGVTILIVEGTGLLSTSKTAATLLHSWNTCYLDYISPG